jgi:predicted phage terminase large subunit-like protein
MERMETDRTVEELLTKMRIHRPTMWWMESELISKSFGPFLRKRMIETGTYTLLDPVIPTKDKRTRARSIQGRMAMRKVRFPRFAHWWPDAKNQLLKFPYGAHDDFVDFIAHIGLGLTKELSASPLRKKVDKIPRTGTGAWVVHAGRREAERRRIAKLKHGW